MTSKFKQLYTKTYTNLCTYAYQFVKSKDISQDVVQEVFIQLWEKDPQLHTLSKPESYLFRAVKNKCIDFLRSESNHQKKETVITQKYYHGNTYVDGILEAKELEHQIDFCLDQMPIQYKEALVLSRFSGLSNKEIALNLEVTIKVVENSIYRGLSNLKKCLNDKVCTIF